MIAVETHELSKRYRRVSALTDCSVTVPEGRVCALVGPNGAGKTTLLRLLAAAACGGAVTALTTWWSGPDNAQFASAFEPGHFDTQGIVPVGYAVFAMALGIAAGTVARRTLPAIAVVLGGFIALRLVISDFLRQHYMAAVTTYYNVTGAFTPPGQAWVLAQGAVSQTGRVVPTGWGDLYPALPASCRQLLPGTRGRSPALR